MMRKLLCSAVIFLFFGFANAQDKLEIVNNAADGLERNLALFKNTADGNRAINIVNFEAGTNTVTKSNLAIFHSLYSGSPNVGGFTGLTNDNSGVYLRGGTLTSKLRFFIGGTALTDSKLTVNNLGVGMGTDDPKTTLDIGAGTLYIRNSAVPILQDANGDCWQLTISTSGALGTSTTTCP